jgi:ACDE family multidrug resistance protein
MYVRHPVWIQRVRKPGAEAFAILFALESLARALLATVIPLHVFALLGDAWSVSLVFFFVSLVSLCGTFAVPWLVRKSARRFVYSGGVVLLALAPLLLTSDGLAVQVAGMMVRVLAVVTMTVCLNIYIMDTIARRDLGRSEPMRVFYSAGAWTLGPALGVYLGLHVSPLAPYAASMLCALVLLGYFWYLRITESPALSQPAGPTPGPVHNVRRYFARPRLALAWLISVARNAWWSLFFIYTPIYSVKSGLGEFAGGLIVSVGMGFLFTMPLWGALLRRVGMRRLLILGFAVSGVCTASVTAFAHLPGLAVTLLLAAALAMVALDVVGNMPFMLAVRPGERAEMTTVYSTYRDAAEILPPGIFSAVLKLFDLPAVFVAGGMAMFAAAWLSRRLHPRLGLPKRKAATLPAPTMATGR